MTTWRQIERETVSLVRELSEFEVRQNGDVFLVVEPADFPISLNLTLFAKELARRLHNAH
jgi:hypothetical protein